MVPIVAFRRARRKPFPGCSKNLSNYPYMTYSEFLDLGNNVTARHPNNAAGDRCWNSQSRGKSLIEIALACPHSTSRHLGNISRRRSESAESNERFAGSGK